MDPKIGEMWAKWNTICDEMDKALEEGLIRGRDARTRMVNLLNARSYIESVITAVANAAVEDKKNDGK